MVESSERWRTVEPMPVIKVITVKRLDTYRGKNDEEWSNGYHLLGDVPADTAAWDELLDQMIVLERSILGTTSKIVRAYGYADPALFVTRGRDIAAENAGVGLPGAPLQTGSRLAAPDMCALVRFRAGQTTKGRPSYVMKWYRSQFAAENGHGLDGAATIQTQLAKLVDGWLPGQRKLCDPQGTLAGGPTVRPYLYSRDVKRRGRRPQ